MPVKASSRSLPNRRSQLLLLPSVSSRDLPLRSLRHRRSALRNAVGATRQGPPQRVLATPEFNPCDARTRLVRVANNLVSLLVKYRPPAM